MLLILFPLDPVLTLLSMSIIPVLFLSIGFFNRRIADVATDVRDADSRVYSIVQWAISSMKVVQAFTKEEEDITGSWAPAAPASASRSSSTTGRRFIRALSIR
jgi:ABC-type multidrug transport system fused ATPase/permease subunit